MSKQNQRRGNVGPIGGQLVDDLNKLKDGLGTRLLREVNHRFSVLNTQLDTQAGYRGTVMVAKQSGVDSSGKPTPGIQLAKDRVAGVAWATDNSDAVPLDQFRSFLTCDFFLQMVEDCIDLPEAQVAAGAEPDCWRGQ